MSDITAGEALNVKLNPNDAGADTVREYLQELLITLLDEEEGFSGKRPFGNSGWIYDIQGPLEEAGFVGDWRELVDAL